MLNAGLMWVPASLTKDGYEVQFGTNHVGHALLTKLLMPVLLKTAEEPGADVRVISLSSMGHNAAPSCGISFPDLKTDMASYMSVVRYGQSKLANILFASELAKHYPSITAVSLHPGVVDTNLYQTIFSGPIGLWGLLGKVQRFFYTSVEDGAKNQLWAAVAPVGEERGNVKSGEYYMPVGIGGRGSKLAKDQALAEKLWTWTEKELESYKA
jgi:NAD(P)-dependent dehydrogenase (short-subunit alcohol dehydrogenase family)